MQIGMIGLGRKGANLVRRMTKDRHQCVVYDVNTAAVQRITGRDIQGAVSLDELAARMAAGDIVIGGGNSCYRHDLARAKALKQRDISNALPRAATPTMPTGFSPR